MVPEQVGTGRGMFQEIPDRGYAGWVCYYNGEIDEFVSERYSCRSVMVGKDERMGFNAPDLTLAKYDIDLGFRCSVETRGEDFDVATCLMALPQPGELEEILGLEGSFGGEYRYSPSDIKRITQFGFVANGEDEVTQNYWVPLGVVAFQGALNGLGVGLATCATVMALLTN